MRSGMLPEEDVCATDLARVNHSTLRAVRQWGDKRRDRLAFLRMLTIIELTSIARARLKDAKALLSERRYDGAVYVCGYAVEIALKARIVKTLKWPGFPDDGGKSGGFKGLKIHDLESLVQFTAWEDKIKARLGADWSVVLQWSPESRYRVPGKVTQSDARQMIESTQRILKALL